MLWPQSVENRAALRTAFAALIALLISFKFHLQTPYWSGMTVVVVSNLYTGSIIDKAMMRIIGTIAGAFLGFYIAGIVANSLLLYFVSCFLIVTICVYYYNFSAYGYAYLLGALCAFIVIAQIALNPQNAFFVAIWRPIEIGIGVVIAAISAYAIFPNHLKDNVLLQVDDIFADFSKEFAQLKDSLLKETLDCHAMYASNLKIKKKIRQAVELIGAMNHEFGVTEEQIDELRAFLDSFYDLARQLQYLIIIAPQHKDFTLLHALPMKPVFLAIQHDLNLLQHSFSKRRPSIAPLQTGKSIEALEQHRTLRQKSYSVESDFIYSLLHFLGQINQSLILMHSLLSGRKIKTIPRVQILNKQERLRLDIDLIKHSIKAGLTVVLALGFWLLSHWPGGLTGIISSLMISIRRNLFDMTNISIYRILGCLLGGGVALFSLYFTEMDLYHFSFIVFFSVWAFSYFMFKSPKYSYIGLQANIALIISIAQEGGPPVFLDIPLQRLAGIFIGIAASFIVANILWRADVWTILRRYLGKLYRYITFNLGQVLMVPKGEKKLHDLANLFWLARGLIESLTEEELSTKKEKRLSRLRHRFENLVAIQATISHVIATINKERALFSAQKLDLDLPGYEKELLRVYETQDALLGQRLMSDLDDCLMHVESRAEHLGIKGYELQNMVGYVNALRQLAFRGA